MASKNKWSRQAILETSEMAHIREALTLGAEAASVQGKPFDIMRPIRETPLSVFFDRADPKSFENERLNPYLPSIWFSRYGIRIDDQASTNPNWRALISACSASCDVCRSSTRAIGKPKRSSAETNSKMVGSRSPAVPSACNGMPTTRCSGLHSLSSFPICS